MFFCCMCYHGRRFGLKCAGYKDAFGSAFSEVLGTMTRIHFFPPFAQVMLINKNVYKNVMMSDTFYEEERQA